MRPLLGIIAVSTLLIAPATAHAKSGCPSKDVRQMLAAAGQGINGRVVEIRETYLAVVAESRYEPRSIRFGETVRVHGKSLPANLQGRIGIVLHRKDGRWTASRCDVVPGWRMANALSGLEPCPKPGVRITRVRVNGLVADVTLRMTGDVTTLRIDSGQSVRRRHFAEPGFVSIVEQVRYTRAGRFRLSVRAEGGFGPGCGSGTRRYATAKRTITII